MHLYYYIDEKGQRVYTYKDSKPDDGLPTQSAHPARFNPKDEYSGERLRIKSRFEQLPTQPKKDIPMKID